MMVFFPFAAYCHLTDWYSVPSVLGLMNSRVNKISFFRTASHLTGEYFDNKAIAVPKAINRLAPVRNILAVNEAIAGEKILPPKNEIKSGNEINASDIASNSCLKVLTALPSVLSFKFFILGVVIFLVSILFPSLHFFNFSYKQFEAFR